MGQEGDWDFGSAHRLPPREDCGCSESLCCTTLYACPHWYSSLSHSQIQYIPPTFADGTAASGELLPGEWRRLAARDNDLLEPGRLSTARASWAVIAVRNDLKLYFQTPQGLGRTQSLEELAWTSDVSSVLFLWNKPHTHQHCKCKTFYLHYFVNFWYM